MTRTAVELLGKPDGPEVFVPEMGLEVGTFTQTHEKPCLTWHVPLEMRGDFRPTDLANYKPERSYRTNAFGKVLCYAKTQADEYCQNKAVNRFPRCIKHGGSLHPLDKVVTEENSAEKDSMTRYQQFKAKLITVEDLDDEELAMGGFRSNKNGKVYRPKNVPREIMQAMQKAIFERANAELKGGVVKAAKTLVDLATDDTVDDASRLRASQDSQERNLGKAKQTEPVAPGSPWEEVFSGIAQISREESRKIREVESSREAIESGSEPVDAEIVEEKKSPEERMHSRDPAILSPTIERPEFEYDTPPSDIVEEFMAAAEQAEEDAAQGDSLPIDDLDW